MEFHSRIPGTLSGIAEKTIKITLHIWYMAKAYTRNELNDLSTYRHLNRTLLIPPVESPMYIHLIEPLIHGHLKRYRLYSIKRGGGGDLFSLPI